jgi:hypothetical protein
MGVCGGVEVGNVGAGDGVGDLRAIDVERVVNKDGEIGVGDPIMMIYKQAVVDYVPLY